MKTLILSLLTLCLLPIAPQAQAAEKGFSDDFKGVQRIMPDGTKKMYPDHTKWAFTFWPGTRWPDSYGDGTNWLAANTESQTYVTPWIERVKGTFVPVPLRFDPFEIKEDGLHITADKLTPEQMIAYKVERHRQFGSGLLLSRYAFQYGEVKIVAKLPSARGTWPALWLLAANSKWPPEIDMLEGMAWGKHAMQVHSGLIATENDNATYGDWFDVGVDPSQDFHEYGLKWTKEKIVISFDGKELLSKPTPPSFHVPMYLLVNLAIGGNWPYNEVGITPIDSIEPERLLRGAKAIEDDYPATMIVKSVKVTEY